MNHLAGVHAICTVSLWHGCLLSACSTSPWAVWKPLHSHCRLAPILFTISFARVSFCDCSPPRARLQLATRESESGAGSPSLARSTRLSRVFQGICEHRTIDYARRRNELRCSFNGSGLSSSVLSGGRSFSRLVNTTTIDLVPAKAFNVPEQGDT